MHYAYTYKACQVVDAWAYPKDTYAKDCGWRSVVAEKVRCIETSIRKSHAHNSPTRPVYVDVRDQPLPPRKHEGADFIRRRGKENLRGIVPSKTLSDCERAWKWYRGKPAEVHAWQPTIGSLHTRPQLASGWNYRPRLF